MSVSPDRLRHRVSQKAQSFTESVIREMTRLNQEHGGVNLAQGFPDFPAPAALKQAAADAIDRDINQYAITWGSKVFRDALTAHYQDSFRLNLDPEKHFTVTCGSTEAMIATILALVDPDEEVIVFEPFYENYGPDAILSGATPRYVTLREPDWSIDPDELEKAFSNKTRAIIINSPNNPTGKVYSREELEQIAQLCQKWDVIAITDEIYEYILYDGEQHIPMASIEGMEDRTVTINSLSKTYSVTGWRVGWAVAPEPLTNAIRKVHDFLTVGAAAPLQEAAAVALGFEQSYFDGLSREYGERRAILMKALEEVGFRCATPKGAYYVMADISAFGFSDDIAFAHHLIKEVGVAAVPGSSFYHRREDGAQKIRFTFCKVAATLEDAAERLRKLQKT